MSFTSLPNDANLQFQETQTEGVMMATGNAADSRKNVRFYMKRVVDTAMSEQMGRTWYTSKPYVFIQEPGERDYIDDPLENKPWAPARFPRQWALYQKSQDQIPDGTPIQHLFPQKPDIGENLCSLGIYTVEQMAGAGDNALQNIGMGAFRWRDLARNYLEIANKGVGAHKLQAELEKRDNEIAVLQNQVALMKTQLERVAAEREQGIPATMIPSTPPATQAQGHAASVKADWTMPQPQSQPSFEPEPDDGDGQPMGGPVHDWTMQGDQAAPSYAPPGLPARRRGRPPKSASAA